MSSLRQTFSGAGVDAACASAAPAPMHGRPAPDPASRHAWRVSAGLAPRLALRALAASVLALAGWVPLGAQAQTVYVSSEKDHKIHVMDAAGKLQKLGVIEYSRGHITVLDRPHLERLCCECYAVVKKETDRLLPYTVPLHH